MRANLQSLFPPFILKKSYSFFFLGFLIPFDKYVRKMKNFRQLFYQMSNVERDKGEVILWKLYFLKLYCRNRYFNLRFLLFSHPAGLSHTGSHHLLVFGVAFNKKSFSRGSQQLGVSLDQKMSSLKLERKHSLTVGSTCQPSKDLISTWMNLSKRTKTAAVGKRGWHLRICMKQTLAHSSLTFTSCWILAQVI